MRTIASQSAKRSQCLTVRDLRVSPASRMKASLERGPSDRLCPGWAKVKLFLFESGSAVGHPVYPFVAQCIGGNHGPRPRPIGQPDLENRPDNCDKRPISGTSRPYASCDEQLLAGQQRRPTPDRRTAPTLNSAPSIQLGQSDLPIIDRHLVVGVELNPHRSLLNSRLRIVAKDVDAV